MKSKGNKKHKPPVSFADINTRELHGGEAKKNANFRMETCLGFFSQTAKWHDSLETLTKGPPAHC
jgi:hypothetical protein